MEHHRRAASPLARQPLFNEATGEIHDGYTIDGGHLTHAGYLVVSGEIKPVIAGLLDDWTLTSQ